MSSYPAASHYTYQLMKKQMVNIARDFRSKLQVQVEASEQIRTKYTSQWTENECMRELSAEMT